MAHAVPEPARLGAVLARVYYLQVVVSEDLEKRAIRVDRNFTFKPRRGSILDRNGVELAVSVKAPSIFAQPRSMEDIEAAIPKLSALLDMSPELLKKRLNPKRSFVWLKRQVTPALAAALRGLLECTGDADGLGDEPREVFPAAAARLDLDGDALASLATHWESEGAVANGHALYVSVLAAVTRASRAADELEA